MIIDLKGNPFFLSKDDIYWVENTLKNMTLKEKIGQMFCPMGFSSDEQVIKLLAEDIGVGGMMYRPQNADSLRETHRSLQEKAKIPMLISGNLEHGGSGICIEGTNYGKPMMVAATNDSEAGYRLGKISCAEGAAVGCNWAFAPIVDIDMNFRNPITNVRTFGSNVDKIIEMASGYMKAADEEGVAVAIKHFPGDGVDERDQHLLTTVNSLSIEDWNKSFGKIYETLIKQGAKSVMVGHIAQPAYQELLSSSKVNELIPATLSKELMVDLLREKLSFNGLICTDASSMIGFTSYMEREKALPYSIACGADVFLFNKSLEEDIGYMCKGIEDGILTIERVDEAVTRILAMKASLKLHTKKKEGKLVGTEPISDVINNSEFRSWTKDCAYKSTTLVKDTQNLLPISTNRTKRIYLNVLENDDDYNSPLRETMRARFEKEGFEVVVRDRSQTVDIKDMMMGKPLTEKQLELMGEIDQNVSDFKSKYDLVIYVANFETASNNTVIRLNWKGFMGLGNDSPWFTKEIPTMFISLANPYHLLDMPMIKTFINAYTNSPDVLDAVVDKIMGRSEFTGVSPVDASCGRKDVMY